MSGLIHDAGTKLALPYVNVMLYNDKDSMFIVGTITDEKGYFSLTGLKNNTGYYLSFSYSGYLSKMYPLLTGQLNNFLDIGVIDLKPDVKLMGDVTVTARKEVVADKMDKKTYSITANTSAAGGSLLEAMKNLPGVTTTQDGKIELRGSDKVMILVDGKQTALTGIGGQASLDNIPSSAIDRIEIINNPSSRYDANGNAGIINIIFKKEKKEGFNGKAGLAGGAGALWIKKDNYPGIRPQYQVTPKFNPSLALNYRKNKLNIFFQGDDLYTKTLNKNEFADRFYDNGEVVLQQTKRNRTTNILTLKSGVDWLASANNTLTISGLFSSEKILDRGDEPFFNKDLSERKRLWQFLEDELKTTVTASASWQHKLRQAGRILNTGFNYTFHREDEKYFFTNTMPAYTGLDSFKLLSDEHVADLNIDYTHPLRHGRFETGFKLRHRWIPVNMQFKPGLNSPLDVSAGGLARYEETIPAIYGNYIYETKKFEIEAGLRLEHVKLQYDVNENHPVYKSDGYNYSEPFPSFRLAYKVND
ncbi:MAG TPA: outer membrane beta-barrel protein, partial [Chitinophagaceae bacterium]|nr:outer membrane beta-barrel protein [Chitinophagaceae bacterium]